MYANIIIGKSANVDMDRINALCREIGTTLYTSPTKHLPRNVIFNRVDGGKTPKSVQKALMNDDEHIAYPIMTQFYGSDSDMIYVYWNTVMLDGWFDNQSAQRDIA